MHPPGMVQALEPLVRKLAQTRTIWRMTYSIKIDGEEFRIQETPRENGSCQYDFSWQNGPALGGYGFFVVGTRRSFADLHQVVQSFLDSFFSPDGVGTSDFPEFVRSRRNPGNRV